MASQQAGEKKKLLLILHYITVTDRRTSIGNTAFFWEQIVQRVRLIRGMQK